MTGDPTQGEMMYDLVKETRDDVKTIKKGMQDGSLQMKDMQHCIEGLENKVGDLEDGQKKIKKTVFEHIAGDSGKKMHFNEGHTESFPQKIVRKKGELTLGGIIAAALYFLLDKLPGLL